MSRRGVVGVLNGNWKNRWRRELEDQQDRRVFIIEANKERFGASLDVLKYHDPEWEIWYDDDANIPPYITWTNSEEIHELCRRMVERAKHAKESRQQPRGGKERAECVDNPIP